MMKYYLIAGEASGDLHASRLMRSLKEKDPEAEFRFFGGDLMAAEGGTLVKHYRELAYMGFIPVLLHLPTILRNMKMCKQDIVEWQPDVVILVDYPGFNLKIAKYRAWRKAAIANMSTPSLLLHLPEDMGVEGVPHQEHQARRRRAVLHPALRGGLLREEAPLPHPLCGQPHGPGGEGIPLQPIRELNRETPQGQPSSPCWQARASRKSRTTCPP